jgi:hypothetical protein
MDGNEAVSRIKHKFQQTGSPASILMLRRGSFNAELTPNGVMVDNLGAQPFLPWIVFQEAVCVMIRNYGRVARGNAINARLGDPQLPLDSIEGHIA